MPLGYILGDVGEHQSKLLAHFARPCGKKRAHHTLDTKVVGASFLNLRKVMQQKLQLSKFDHLQRTLRYPFFTFATVSNLGIFSMQLRR
ncbi:hypothetical protein B9Z45_14500 [Limnohabitans sp. 2KL-17]|nr:hypothetical protein B9Z45_14500 [Limnohabitans sp. 2KL-17]